MGLGSVINCSPKVHIMHKCKIWDQKKGNNLRNITATIKKYEIEILVI